MDALIPLDAANAQRKTRFVPARRVAALLPGLALSGVIAATAIFLGSFNWAESHGFGALTIAIVLGVAIGNTALARLAAPCDAGLAFSRQYLLRLGVVLYGLRLTFRDLGDVGVAGILIDTCVLCSTFALATLLGVRVFKLDRNTAMLIGAGSSICGAAAVMATGPVVRARAEQIAVAVATVVLFGTLSIFLYPLLYHLNLEWGLLDTSPAAFGIYAGSTIHEVAQVVAAARAVTQEAANTAVIAKMVRVMMLAPFLILLSAWLARTTSCDVQERGAGRARIVIPWFAFAFIGVVALHSLFALPPSAVAYAINVDTWLLAMAMASLGVGTRFSALLRAGIRPMLLGATIFAWLVVGGMAINKLVALLLT